MTAIFSRTRFEGFHCWPSAPQEVAFLRQLHRHEFHVTAFKKVNHSEREIEFILYKRRVDEAIVALNSTNDTTNWSCERWAEMIGHEVEADCVEVSEDGENGARWMRD
jgi:hypothetical protein